MEETGATGRAVGPRRADDSFRLAGTRLRMALVLFIGGSFLPFGGHATLWQYLYEAVVKLSPEHFAAMIRNADGRAMQHLNFLVMTIGTLAQVVSFFVMPWLTGALQRSPVGLLLARVAVPVFLIAGGFYYLQRLEPGAKETGLVLLAVAMVHQVLGLWYIPRHPDRPGRQVEAEDEVDAVVPRGDG